MGRDVCEASPAARAVYEAADAALGLSLSRLCFEGPEDELRRTENQQPAILTTSIALLRALEESGEVRPAYVGGHSLGEYSALVAAGALGFEDAVRTVQARGRYMQEAVAEGRGAMAAVMGCSPELNSPQQTVIAGESGAVAAACERAIALGAKRCVPLPVSAPFHCALMAPAAEKLRHDLARLRFVDARPPVVTNVEATPNSDATRMPALLEQQVTAPVRFTEMVERLAALGVGSFLEVGPGRVLSGLLARIDRRSRRGSFGSWSELTDARAFIAMA